MFFRDRREAGKKLAEALKKYDCDNNAVVLGLPRGGIVVASEVARALALPLDIVVPRKIGAESNPEYAIGAITETGEAVWNEGERRAARAEYLNEAIAKEQREALRRLKLYRGSRPPRNIKKKTVILIDDGVATGLTVRAAVKTLRAEQPEKIIIAVPHGAADSLAALAREADEVVALDIPEYYSAVGQWYESFPQVADEEVVTILRSAYI